MGSHRCAEGRLDGDALSDVAGLGGRHGLATARRRGRGVGAAQDPDRPLLYGGARQGVVAHSLDARERWRRLCRI